LRHVDHDHDAPAAQLGPDAESSTIAGAIRTDFILSAEIMAIALADVANRPMAVQAAALAVVGLGITIGVYGVVAMIVKMDDIGLHLAKGRRAATRGLGRGLVKGMPHVLDLLTKVGTAAMLWVGGGIIVHGLDHFGASGLEHLIHSAAEVAGTAPLIGAITGWLATALASAVVGLTLGGAIVGGLRVVRPHH
jgi:predicted DNA repair protein MutK